METLREANVTCFVWIVTRMRFASIADPRDTKITEWFRWNRIA